MTKFEYVCGHFLFYIRITILEWFPIDIFVILWKPNLFITQIVLKSFPQDKKKGTSIFFLAKNKCKHFAFSMCSRFQIWSESELIQTTRSFGNYTQKITRLYQCMKLKLLTLLRTSRSLIFGETGWQRWASGYTKSFILWLRSLTLQLHVLDYSPLSELCYFLTTTSHNPKFANNSTFKSERLQPKDSDPVLLVFDSFNSIPKIHIQEFVQWI